MNIFPGHAVALPMLRRIAALLSLASLHASASQNALDLALIPAINGFRSEFHWLPAKAYSEYSSGKYVQRKDRRYRFTPVVGVILVGSGLEERAEVKEFSDTGEWHVMCAGLLGERKSLPEGNTFNHSNLVEIPRESGIAFPVGLNNMVKLREIDNLYAERWTYENGERTKQTTDRLGARPLQSVRMPVLALYPLVTSSHCMNMPRVVIATNMNDTVKLENLDEDKLVDASFVLVVSNNSGEATRFDGFKSKAWKMELRQSGTVRKIDLGQYVQSGGKKFYDGSFDVYPGESFALLLGLGGEVRTPPDAKIQVSYDDGVSRHAATMDYPPGITVREPPPQPYPEGDDGTGIEF